MKWLERKTRRIAILRLIAALLLALTIPFSTVALPRDVRLQIIKAAVRLGPIIEIQEGTTRTRRALTWGSGSIVSPDGLILTNAHVVDTSQLEVPYNARVVPGVFAVYITTQSDQPPVVSYIAEAVVVSAELDLAVLRITRRANGDAVDPSKLSLPYVVMGDSDQLEPGDSIYIIGYPGIGGETVTFTAGVVSGFTSEGGISRAWIKTDAAISGGNSGGTCVDDAGLLVGIPTQVGRGGVGENPQYVDCRPLADTNGNGILDDGDVCVPVGGFINALRPVALAKPLVAQAQQQAPMTPAPTYFPTPTPNRTPAANRTASPTRAPLRSPTPLPQPSPTVQVASRGVQVVGRILDAYTGWPIPGALFVVLRPGISYADWETDEDIYSYAYADAQGAFVLPDLLARGTRYTLAAGLRGYMPVYQDGVPIDAQTPDIVEITVWLQGQN